MKTYRYLISIALLLTFLFLQSCGPDKKCKMTFSGKIVDNAGQPLKDVTIALADSEGSDASTDGGQFRLCVGDADQYVLNFTRLGFGLVSKVYSDTASQLVITMTPATVGQNFEANDNIVLQDNPPPTQGPLSSNISATSPLDTIPFVYDGEGRLIAFEAPQEVIDTYDAAEASRGAGPGGRPRRGARVEVPANALVDEGEEDGNNDNEGRDKEKNKGKITGSLSTIDIYNPDGMPGNYTVRTADGSVGWMETYGAADITFTRDGKKLQLRQGQYATVTIPVDTITVLVYGKNLPAKMPLLVYDPKSGLWQQDVDKWTKEKVFADLAASKDSYVAKVSHFSTFNMDEEFSTPTCYRMCAAGIPTGPTGARIEVSVPGHIKPFFPFDAGCATGCPTGRTGHGVIYMKPNKPMGVRISDNAGVIKSTYVFMAGGPSTPHVTTCDFLSCSGPSNIDYSACYVNTGGARPGSMTAPILAVKKGLDKNSNGTIDITSSTSDTDEGDYFGLSWVYVDPSYTISATDGSVVNPAINYKVEYATAGNMDDYGSISWCEIKDLDIATAGQQGEFTGKTEWKIDTEAVINTANDASAACLPLQTTIFLRVRYQRPTESYNAAYVVYKINMPTSPTSQLLNTFNETCSIQ